jgi:hypothetical protein
MPQRIHLIERLGSFKRVEGNVFESWCWNVTPEVAETLVGCDIYFHKKQKEPSHFGGKILAYRIHDSDEGEHSECNGRAVFTFEYSREHKNVLAGDGGWSYEKKIV